jgi:hypothetical protein
MVAPLVFNKNITLKHIKMKYSKSYYSTRCFSTHTNNHLSNSALPSKELDSILIGLILSDAGLYRSSPTSNTRFEMSFGQAYKEFAYFIGELLSPYVGNPVKSVDIRIKDKVYTNYRLKTKTLPLFNYYFDMFYKIDTNSEKYFKIVPENIKDLMDPIVLAYLIMGDGNFDKGRNRVRIYTNSFIKQEVEELALSINNNLGIYTGVLHDKNDQWILTIGAKNLELLRNTVSPYFHFSMLYRIGL